MSRGKGMDLIKLTRREVYTPIRGVWNKIKDISAVDLPLVKSIDGLSVVGLQNSHGILTQQFEYLGWQIDRAIIPFEGHLGS